MTGCDRGAVDVVLADLIPAEARAAVRAAGGAAATDDLQLAVTEVVANAHEHGRPPVEVVLRRAPGRIAVVVRDRGQGPSEAVPPLHAPPEVTRERGRGRWLAHHLVDVDERRVPSGFEVHLTACLPDTGAERGTDGGTGRESPRG